MEYKLSKSGKTLLSVNRLIENFTIPDDVLYVYNKAFNGCYKLKFVNCNNVEKIYDNVFTGCEQLEIVLIPNTKSIGSFTFWLCPNLHTIKTELNKDQLLNVFGGEDHYNNYLQRNRDIKLNKLLYGI